MSATISNNIDYFNKSGLSNDLDHLLALDGTAFINELYSVLPKMESLLPYIPTNLETVTFENSPLNPQMMDIVIPKCSTIISKVEFYRGVEMAYQLAFLTITRNIQCVQMKLLELEKKARSERLSLNISINHNSQRLTRQISEELQFPCDEVSQEHPIEEMPKTPIAYHSSSESIGSSESMQEENLSDVSGSFGTPRWTFEDVPTFEEVSLKKKTDSRK